MNHPLVITNFYDPEPVLIPICCEVYVPECCGNVDESNNCCNNPNPVCCDKPAITMKMHEAHTEWQRRQVKPECPKSISDLIARQIGYNEITAELRKDKFPDEHKDWTGWRSKEKYYQANRLKYGDFQKRTHAYTNGHVWIMKYTSTDWRVWLALSPDVIYQSSHLSQKLFEQICYDNGIKLNRI